MGLYKHYIGSFVIYQFLEWINAPTIFCALVAFDGSESGFVIFFLHEAGDKCFGFFIIEHSRVVEHLR